MVLSPALEELGWCPFAVVSGKPCLLCGGTRAFLSLANGNFTEALNYNALVTFGVILMVAVVLISAARDIKSLIIVSAIKESIWTPLRLRIEHFPGRTLIILAFAWIWNIGRW